MAIRLAAFDLDGTLTRGETICQVLAKPLGWAERMEVLELASGREAIRAAREEMAGWYRGRRVEELCSYLDAAVLAPGVVEGFRLLKQHGVELAVVSITWLFAVEWFAERLGADVAVGTGLSASGAIEHVWAEDKAARVAQLAARRGIDLEEIAAVGDSSGDVPMLRLAGLPVFVGRSVPAVLPRVVHMPQADIAVVARRIIGHR
jgi:HAD superfamily phosphoserine phosphatase-like hydrolase